VARCGGRTKVAAGLTTLTILLIVLAPLGLVTFLAVSEGVSVASDLDVRTVQQRLSRLRATLGLDSPYAEVLRKIDAGLRDLELETASAPEVQKAQAQKLLERVDELEKQITAGPAAAAADGQTPAADPGMEQRAEEYLQQRRELIAPLRESLEQVMAAYPGSLESERSISNAQAAHRRLKTQLLGGASRAWLKQVANPTEDELRDVRNRAFDQFQGGIVTLSKATGVATLKLLIGLVIMIIALYFFLADGPKMLTTLMHLSPLDDAYENELLAEFIKISRAVVVATLLSALVQGFLMGLGFWVARVHAVFLLASVTAVFALIPFVGAWSVWVPVCLWLFFYEERTVAAVGLAIYGALIVSTSDNVIKALVLHGQSGLHPLLALLSVLGGVAALGPIGILVGPMVVVFLQTLLNIMQRELAVMDARALAPGGSPASPLSVSATPPESAARPEAEHSPPAATTGVATPAGAAVPTEATQPANKETAPPKGKRPRRSKR
jgi:predicted PurR-regulated permease PerM